MNRVPPLIQIPAYEPELVLLVDDGTGPFDQQAAAPVREDVTRHRHEMSEVRLTVYGNCPACGEQVGTLSHLPYARCRLPEGCGHMFCRTCLVDYLPVMREGNHQHRSDCRHYEPFDRVDTPPAYTMPLVQEHYVHPMQVQVVQNPRFFVTPNSDSQVRKWSKWVLWAIFAWLVLEVALAFFMVFTGHCGCHQAGPNARIAAAAASPRISD
ncbi:unnamed protein product [Rhizoctonia solani]|uniref:RING-type domain-containing protein n=1 Tax=Rhizoctonia solani TaxID=456999 RepID=A0A8H2XM88_9AGAM|nr:unnamed protein product [Rhizoctonia solani]